MEYKFLKDGRKVAVIDTLGGCQLIVQEVFVEKETGNEILGGDKFVVSSVFDMPVETWHEKKIRESKESYEAKKHVLEREHELLNAEHKKWADLARAKIVALKLFSSNAAQEQLQAIEHFLTGKIEFIACPDKYRPEIVRFDEKIADKFDGRFEGIKLLSIFGASNGDLSFRINSYQDGSGGWDTLVPCADYGDALSVMQAACDKKAAAWVDGEPGSFNFHDWESIAGIVIPEPAKAKQAALRAQSKADEIAKIKARLYELEGGA